MDETTAPRYRPLDFGITRGTLRDGAPGVRYLKAEAALADYPATMTERFVHWATVDPRRTLVARRARHADGAPGDWVRVSYGEALEKARVIAQALLDRGLSAERPVAILSENSIEHLLMALGCLVAGVPHCPVSPAYSTVSQDYEKLRHVLHTLTPGLVFASDAKRYGRALDKAVPKDCEVVLVDGTVEGRAVTSFADLLATEPTSAVDAAMAAITPETITKFLFTSGSTKLPKAVINTHRMWCANQQQMRQSMPAIAQEPPVLIDWLPWNHTFGGNHNVGMVLNNGGTLYIDDGKPTPAGMAETLRNLHEIAPTLYFNVPTGFEAIAIAMETDAALRKTLFSRVKMFFYAGAALAQPVWDSLHQSAEREVGERIVMGTGLGMTESGPFALYITGPHVASGDLGLPTAGLELKLIDVDGKTEVRYRGPNIMPGYWRAPDATAQAFDQEGYFASGDAVTWIDETDIHRGLRFDGRIAEDFKLATGTFVSVGPLRSRIIAAGAPYLQDAVLTGLNLKEVGALLFPTQAIRVLAGLPAVASMQEVIASAPVTDWLRQLVDSLAKSGTGSANRIARAALLAEPPSIDKGEVTDKGSINQRAVLKCRTAEVQALHAGTLAGTTTPSKP